MHTLYCNIRGNGAVVGGEVKDDGIAGRESNKPGAAPAVALAAARLAAALGPLSLSD